ncbi:unnamed protein product [Phytomonas sp. EM1]|nr:unnamed protein product [Phytomonas sp. EM1]|eukprot:CCW60514.1 unnamed protein product [Phytomonas sp. isolate EM1]
MSAADDATLGNSLKHGAAPCFAAGTPHTLSVSELRTAIQQQLKKNGALKTLKTHVRGMLLTELMRQEKRHRTMAAQQRAPSDRDGVISPETFERLRRNEKCELTLGELPQQPDHSLPSSPTPFTAWAGCLADTLIEEHLRSTRRNMSLSIFSTEVEVPPLSDTGSPSDERERLEQLLFLSNSPSKNNEGESLEDDGIPRVSVLQRLVMQRIAAVNPQSPYHRLECSTQTEDDLMAPSSGETSTSLECRLAAVDAKYALAFSRLGRSNDSAFFTRAEVERRLNSYKSDVHEQLRREYQHKHKLFEESKLREAKETLEARYQLMIQNKNEELREMERSLLVKYEQERQRLQRTREDIERQRLDLERRQKEMRTIVNDYEEQLTEQDAVQRELREKLRVAQLQSAKWEELSGSRLMEVEAGRSREQRRVDDLRRMQADHAAELRLKDEELSRLRFRMRMLVNRASDRGTRGDPRDDEKAPNAVQDDLYGMLVRTEELQRNALQQQQTWMVQASREQQRLEEQWGTTAAAGPSRGDRRETPVATPPPPAVANVISEGKTPGDVAGAPPSTPSPQRTDAPHELATAVRESAGGDGSRSSSTTSASEASARNPSSGSISRETVEENQGGNIEIQPPIRGRVSAGGSSTSSKPSSPTSDTSGSPTQIKKESLEDSNVSNAWNNAANSEEASKQSAVLQQILEEEETSRKDIQGDEDSAHKGIGWAEKSQRAVIEARLQEKRELEKVNSGGELRGIGSIMSRLATQQEPMVEADIIFRDSSDDDDSVLFNKNDSTGSSF